jgi:hypothetical protein
LEDKEKEHKLPDLMKFFSTDDRPVSTGEFWEFWESLSEEEKLEFKKAELE